MEGATDNEVFLEYVRRVLTPSLRPGDCVIMDNLAPHRAPIVEELITATGATVRLLPAYSPDLNPIEKMWSKIKEYLRSARARTYDALVSAIRDALKSVTAEDAANWFASCGYTIT
jgi:transposase